MKQSLSLVILLILAMAAAASAEAPYVFSYQGRLLDNAGDPVADDTYMMVLRLWTAPSGGSLLWDETQPVPVANGLFSVKLGEDPSNLLDPTIFSDNSPYLGVDLGGVEILRVQLVSSPFAIQAANADLLQGLQATEFANIAHFHVADDLISGNLSNARFSAYSDLSVEGYLDNNSSTDLLIRSQSDGRYSTSSHTHSGYSSTTHTHSGYSSTTHTHTPTAPIKVQAGFSVVIHKVTGMAPIAHAVIFADGTVGASTGNVTCYWDAPNSRYIIGVSGESIFYRDYPTSITLLGGSSMGAVVFPVYTTFSGNLVVYLHQR